ncbi:MAG: Ger(x)C family spore germination protein [Clostridia bacterium]|nr:Ger(x)C family spore germination protein [Clostridia bacterium]
MKKKILLLIILIIFAFESSACWDRQELDSLAIVFGLGIDKAASPEEIKMTAQIVKPGEIKGTSEGQSGGRSYINLSTTGDTSFRTIRNFTFQSSRKLFWSHNNVIIFGEDLAKEGLEKYIDFFLRDPEVRRTVWILIAKGPAGTILEADPTLEKIPASDIGKLIEDRKVTSQVAGVNLHEFASRLFSKTTAPVAPLIDITEENKQKIAKIIGTAVFKKGQMVGTLNQSETRGLLWVLDEVGSGIIVVNAPKSGEKVSLEIIRSSTKIIPEIKNGTLHITIKIKEEGNLGEQMAPEDLTDPILFSSLEKRQA